MQCVARAVERNSTYWLSLKVHSRVETWKKNRGENQLCHEEQLEWEAHIIQYVNFIYGITKVHGNAKEKTPTSLSSQIPLYGPRFVPPTYLNLSKRDSTPVISPTTLYLKPVNIIHPLYFDGLAVCPQCSSSEVMWDGWTTSGHRELHGIQEEETAIGLQLKCKECEKKYSKAKGNTRDGDENRRFCFPTTNPMF